jgi:hypothetical protein
MTRGATLPALRAAIGHVSRPLSGTGVSASPASIGE